MKILMPLENIRGFLMTRPPLVIFTLCLMCFAVTLVSLAYYVKVQDLENPDITKDWNAFLKHFSKMEFCMTKTAPANEAHKLVSSKGDDESAAKEKRSSGTSQNVSSSSSPHYSTFGDTRNHSFSVTLQVDGNRADTLLSQSDGMDSLFGSIKASDLPFDLDDFQGQINMRVTFEIVGNQSLADACRRSKPCDVEACVTFEGPSSYFPEIRVPPMCYNQSLASLTSHHLSDLAIIIRQKEAQVPVLLPTPGWCHDGAPGKLLHKPDSALSVPIDLDDRSVINLHLMHTSYFVFVMIMTLFCYAIVKGGRSSAKFINDKSVSHELLIT